MTTELLSDPLPTILPSHTDRTRILQIRPVVQILVLLCPGSGLRHTLFPGLGGVKIGLGDPFVLVGLPPILEGGWFDVRAR